MAAVAVWTVFASLQLVTVFARAATAVFALKRGGRRERGFVSIRDTHA